MDKPDPFRALATTALDLLGLLLVAAGVAAAVFPALGWGCLAVAGVVVLAGSAYADRQPGPGMVARAQRLLVALRARRERTVP